MKYLIGVDAGGSNTTAAAFDLQGNFLCDARGGFGNITVDLDKAAENICHTVDAVMAQLPGDECVYLCPGIAGVGTGNRMQRFMEILQQKYGFAIEIINDAQLAMMALFEGGDGALVIAGTGSVALGKSGGKEYRCGGYGTVLGDEGSGYYLVVQAMKTALRRYDEGLPHDALMRGLLDAVHGDGHAQLVELVTSGTKAEVAALAPMVVQTAADGCGSAQQVLREAGEALGQMTVRLLRRMQVEEPAIALSGSIITKVMPVQRQFEACVREAFPKATLIKDSVYVPKGAYYQYLQTRN